MSERTFPGSPLGLMIPSLDCDEKHLDHLARREGIVLRAAQRHPEVARNMRRIATGQAQALAGDDAAQLVQEVEDVFDISGVHRE